MTEYRTVHNRALGRCEENLVRIGEVDFGTGVGGTGETGGFVSQFVDLSRLGEGRGRVAGPTTS